MWYHWWTIGGSIFPVTEPKYMFNYIYVRGADDFQFFINLSEVIEKIFWRIRVAEVTPSLKHIKNIFRETDTFS